MSSAPCLLLLNTRSPSQGAPSTSKRPAVGKHTGCMGFLTLGPESEATVRTSHLPFPAVQSPGRMWVSSAVKTTDGCQSLRFTSWKSWNSVPGTGLPWPGESGLWGSCSVCRSQISSELHTPFLRSSHRLEGEKTEGGVWRRKGRWGAREQPPPQGLLDMLREGHRAWPKLHLWTLSTCPLELY